MHGSVYWGTHALTVVGVQAGADAGSGHFSFGGHAGSVAPTQGVVSVWQTMPAAQSAFVVHGLGTHSLTVIGLQSTGGQFAFGGHAMAGHATGRVVVWHV